MRYRRLASTAAAAAALAIVSAAPADAAKARLAGVTACPSAAAAPAQGTVAQVESTVLCLVNRERTSRGLKRLRASAKLADAATGHSQDMVRRNYFDHISPGGGTMLERIKSTGWLRGGRSYRFAENIAWGSDDLAKPANIVEKWMQSPPHRRNILSGAYSELGVGVALGTPRQFDGATYTTNFGDKS